MKKNILLIFLLIITINTYSQTGFNINCIEDYEITDTLYRTNSDFISVSDQITSNAVYDNSTDSYYSAGDRIELINGFRVVVGTEFSANIEDCESSPCLINGMHAAFAEFNDESYSISYSGTNVVITTNGLPNHTSPYWSNTNERCINGPMGTRCTNTNTTVDHPLYIDPYVANEGIMSPGNIDQFSGNYTLTVPQNPTVASNSNSTGLGAIGLAVSGSVIYNDEEGPNVPLLAAVGSLDYNGAHTGPQSYHYHLEPKAWSNNDFQLIGIMADGFFIYGRKCYSTGDYPTDLDATNGHTAQTQHSCSPEYHYHIENELYLGEYYILFPNDFAGTPSSIN